MPLLKALLVYSGLYCWLHQKHEWSLHRFQNYRTCYKCGRQEVKVKNGWMKV